jgi:type IV pilus assembly protein PilE
MRNRINRGPSAGFTLIELMVTVAVVGILAAVALPSYQASVLKGRRAEGRAALLELLQSQERYATQNNCYLAFSTTTAGMSTATARPTVCGGGTPTTVPFKNFSGDNLTNASYTLSAAVCSPTLSLQDCVLLTATPVKTDAEVGDLSITSTGQKSCSVSNSTKCWR